MKRYWQFGKEKSNGSRNAMENTKEKSVTGNPCKEEKTKKSNEEEEEKNAHAEIQKEDQLKSAKSKVGEIREENERLKLLLARMIKDYQSLQMHFSNILEQEEAKKSTDTSPACQDNEELVSLRLGRVSSGAKKDERQINNNLSHGNEDEKFKEGLPLGLDCRFEFNSTEAKKNPSPENTFKELKEEEPSQMWPPSKILKTTRSEDEEVFQQPNLKKARVSVRARCDTPTMNDGCQWRKYGQKIAKGNPCPRAYYRCTVSPTCPVRKQVQRWSEDMSILITTYEGTHNHPLPISATALASTTSAAASLLQCRSSTSQPGLGNSVSATNSTSTAANLHGLNITFSENAKPHQFYFPNSSISTSNSHPTIVLDLTAPTAFSHFNTLLSTPRYNSPTCLNFSSPSSTNSFEHRTLQTSWSNGYSNYGTLSSYNKNIQVGALNLGNQQPPQEHIYMQMNRLTPPQQSLTETIAATTKVITSNPTFQSALAAAISSYIGNGGGKAQQNLGGGESSDFNFNWGESFPTNPADSSSAQNGIGYGSSFLNKLLSSKNPQQQENMSILPLNSLPFPTSKSASGSPVDAEDQVRL